MAACLIGLGSNLGDRAEILQHALDKLHRLPQTQLVARSAWQETPPIGGPAGQGPFLNGALLLATSLSPQALLANMHGVEAQLGRVREVRWEARTIDLDLLVYGNVVRSDPTLTLPHPRLAFRRFVLEPAAEIVPWMQDPDSGWTVAALLAALRSDGQRIAVAATDAQLVQQVIDELSRQWPSAAPAPELVRWSQDEGKDLANYRRPQLVLAVPPDPGSDRRHWRKILGLPHSGPVAWLAVDRDEALREALAAIQCVMPQRSN